jgi:hypothetical protein
MTRIISIGFTGTRAGMTKAQLLAVHSLLAYEVLVTDWEDAELHAHHGDCTGADAQFHVIATISGFRVIGHPGPDGPYRAHCQVDELRPERPFLDRDRDIVAESRWLIAAPLSRDPVKRSGTWATIRYSLESRIPVQIVMPHGDVVPGDRLLAQVGKLW